MSGPWEKYQTQDGPWTKYAVPSNEASMPVQENGIVATIGNAVDSYKKSLPYSTSPIGMLNNLNDLVSKGANKVGEMATEELGKKQVNPYVSAGVGTLASMAPQIIQAINAPNLSKEDTAAITNNLPGRFLGKQLSNIGKQLSGNQPEDIQTLFKQPEKFFAPSMEKAKSLYGEAVASEGPVLPVDEKSAFEASAKTAKKIIGQLKTAPDTVDPLDALEGRRSLDEVISSTKSSRKLAKLYALRKPLDEVVKSSPQLEEADKIYAASKLASKFRNFMPVTKNGAPAFFKSTLASLASGYMQNPAPTIATSPMFIGGVTTAAGGLNNLITGLAQGGPKYAPLLRALMNQYQGSK